jgi:hypothetical protein
MRNLRSARPIFCFDSSTPEFCTRPRWSCDGESAWSILNKFQWLNRLPLNALLAPLGRADLIDAEPNLDLRFASMIDVKTTSTNLGISSARITRAFVPIQNQTLARAIFSNVLRYCPICLIDGFHATLFQCLLLDQCPIHCRRLQENCPQCHDTIEYRLNASAAANPYSCPRCLIGLSPSIDAACGRPILPSAERIGALFRWQEWIETHSDIISLPPREFGAPDAIFHASIFARLKFMKDFQTIFPDFPMQTSNFRSPSHQLAIRWLDTPNNGHPIKRLSYVRKKWQGFRGIYRHLESDYETAVDRIRQTLDIAGLITHRKQSSNSCSFGLAVLTLWSMAWEGTLLPATFNRHNHPAFGIAVWLTLQRRPHTNFHVSHQELRRKFRTALEDSLASAMTLARGMNAHGIYLFEPRLLLPTIFDSARSQRFANRNL